MSPQDEREAERLAELWYHADGFTDMAEAGTLPLPKPWIADALTAEHSGDCTKQPWSCMRCHAEEIMPVARWVAAALRQPGAEYRRGKPSGETLEQYGDRIAAKVRRVMMDRLDDDVIGRLGQSHIIFGKACAMEAVTTAMEEVRLLPESTKGEGR